MIYVTHMSYREVEELKNEGRITEDQSNIAHFHHKIISDELEIVRDAEDKIMDSIRVLNKIVVKDK